MIRLPSPAPFLRLLLAALALGLAACAPDPWQGLDLRGPGRVAVESGTGGRTIHLHAVQPGFAVFALHRPAPELAGARGRAQLRFTCRAIGPGLPLAAWLSAGPGWDVPAVRHALEPAADGRPHAITVDFDLSGLPEDAVPVLQLAVVGEVAAGGALELSRLDLAPLPSPALGARLVSPGSRTLPAGAQGQAVVLELESRGKARNFSLAVEPEDVLGPSVAAEVEVLGQGRVDLPLPPLPAGDYSITARADQGEGLWLWSLRAAPPLPAPAALEGGMLRRAGAPFFPIGVFHASDPVLAQLRAEPAATHAAPVPDREAMLASLAARGFNAVHHSWFPASPEFHRAAARHGLLVVSELEPGGLPDLSAQRAEPNALGWYAWDEPTASSAPQAAAAYLRLKAADPLRPVLAATDNGCAGFGPYRFADLVLSDIYPVDGPQSDLGPVAESVRVCRQVHLTGDPRAAVLAVPQLFTADTERWKGFAPTLAQVRAQAYAALAAGAAGIMYYAYATFEPLAAGMPGNPARTHWFLPESPLWDGVGALNAELARVGPLLLAGRDTPAALDVRTGIPFRAADADGTLVLAFANPRATPDRITVRCALPGLAPQAVGDAPPPAPAGDATWAADLPPYGAGAWIFSAQ